MANGISSSWIKTRTAWQEIEYRRAKRAQFIKNDLAQMDTMNSTLADALQNRISGSSNIAAQAALKRVQAAAKAKLDENTKQIDDAQKLLDTTQKAVDSSSSTSTSTSVDTII